MRKQSTYIAMYRDSPTARKMYFGPFVSVSIAADFVEGLPDPLPGGFKKFSQTQPFGLSDLRSLSALILNSRHVANDAA